jgi:hypothetical protein
MIDRAIIMLTDRRFWGRASGPSSSGKTPHYWYAHAARRSALPRERFSRVLGMFSSLEVKVLYPT